MKLVFMGTPMAAVPCLEKLIAEGHQITGVWTQPDKPAGRGNKLTAPPVKDFAVQNGLEVFQPVKIKTPESVELFRSRQAEIAIVVAYGRILPESYLTAFPKGCLNVHFSLLPKYRGAAPVNWAIVNGETKTGVTTMQMDAGLDTGNILLQKETDISNEETAVELMSRLAVTGAELLAETLRNLENITPISQNNEFSSYAPIMKKEDGLLVWNLKANEIHNRVRGFQPFPTVFTFYQGKKVTLWKTKVVENIEVEQGESGKILKAKGDDLIVACGENTFLAIEELQIEGKRRMNVRDFLNGIRLQNGEIFG